MPIDYQSFDRLLKEFTHAVESGDGTALADLFCADGIYNDGFYGSFRGHAAIKAMLEDHFWGHARDFRWQMKDPVCNSSLGYAHYEFSYRSSLPEALNRRVTFVGMAKFVFKGEKIREYSEVFNTGLALVQLGFEPARVHRHLEKKIAAENLRSD